MSPGALEESRKSLDLISLPEAARMLGLKPFAIYDLLRRFPGAVPTERVNRTIAIRLEDLPKLRNVIEEWRQRQDRLKDGLTADGRWLTSQGAAQRLGVSVRTIRRWTLEGRVKGHYNPRVSPLANWTGPVWRWDPRDIDKAKEEIESEASRR